MIVLGYFRIKNTKFLFQIGMKWDEVKFFFFFFFT